MTQIALVLLLALTSGNLTARGTDSFAFDAANRLTTATVAGVTTTTGYDGDGVRVSEQTGAAPARSLINDVDTGLPVVLDDGERRYVWGPTGLAYTVTGSAIEVVHADRLGSVRTLTDGSGSIVATSRTDEFGIPTASTGTTAAPYGYTGEPEDASGLVHLRARHYDPSLGRFTSRDTWSGDPLAGQTHNRYSYVTNDPLTRTDPSGHCGIDAALDLGFIGVSAGMLVSGPEKDRGTNALALGADVVSLAIPCATGLGMLVRGGRAVDGVVDGIEIARVPAVGDDLLRPGPWAVDSVPSGGPWKATQAERDLLQPIGDTYGCHSCGTLTPGTGSGNWIPDHQPPSRLAGDSPQVLMPHCQMCSNSQGLHIINLIRQGKL